MRNFWKWKGNVELKKRKRESNRIDNKKAKKRMIGLAIRQKRHIGKWKNGNQNQLEESSKQLTLSRSNS